VLFVANRDGLLRPLLLVLVVKERQPKQRARGDYVGSAVDGEAFQGGSGSRTALDFVDENQGFAGYEPEFRMDCAYGGKNGIRPEIIAEYPCVTFVGYEIEVNI